MLRRATPISLSGHLVDLVGTGGDGFHTVNVSTMAAIVAAAAGVRMVKHGNRSASSSCGAADVLEALGVVIDLPPEQTAGMIEDIGIGFLFAAQYHPALRHTASARRDLGVPTVFNFLGPVANPARPSAQAVGVADPGWRDHRRRAGRPRLPALVFRGEDGLDELEATSPSTVWVVHASQVAKAAFSPADLGLRRRTSRTCAAATPRTTPP